MKQIKRILAGMLCFLMVFLLADQAYAAQKNTITDNGKVTIKSSSSKTDHWIVYKAKKSGVVTLSTTSKKCKATLCNSKKKAITGKASFGKSVSDSKSYNFAVKKGQTYYIKLNFSSTATFSCKFSHVSASGGDDYRSAENLKLSQKKKGLACNSEICKYYRFDVDVMSYQPITFSVKTPKNSSSGFTIDLVNAVDLPLMADMKLSGTQSYTFQNTLGPGTYYIVVKSTSKKTTGQYMITYGANN